MDEVKESIWCFVLGLALTLACLSFALGGCSGGYRFGIYSESYNQSERMEQYTPEWKQRRNGEFETRAK